MSTVRGWEPIGDIVDGVCREIGDNFGHLFGDAYGHAVDYLRELNYDSTNTPKQVCLPIDAALKRAYLPSDFVNYLGVGHIRNNDIVMLGYNPYMSRPCLDDCGNESLGKGGLPNGELYQFGLDGAGQGTFINPDGSNANGADALGYPTWWWRQDYGQGGGWNSVGYYKVDKKNGWIDFNTEIRIPEIVLVYISNGFTPNEANMIPEMMFMAMKDRLKWKMFEYKADISGGRETREWQVKANKYRGLWQLSHRKAEQRQRSQPLYEIVAASRRAYGPHIKM